ncbi:hypothetical protein [Nitrospina watsonii]|uniref:tRNA nucleotidyltransferase, CC-adding n=1 Tax=Nitrospina watsonii TaxID=1323948 RepID=A0ABN8W0E8_9BACT|nr:hypothetical protein [Nitrospina watsonii]CAI2718577.1 tRNA nucleotidyltransferase, CC-adding [Nitrospina watsonii]
MPEAHRPQLEQLHRLGHTHPVYVVGGTLRDRAMNKSCADFDFACVDAPLLARRFAADHRLTLVPLDGTPGRETFRVVIQRNVYFDFSTLQGTTLEDDLAHRDFTVNAMGQLLEDYIHERDTVQDPFHGRRDIEDRVLRALPGPVFEDDPLRLLRIHRFANTLGFDIDSATTQHITETRGRIRDVAAERLSYELLILLGTAHAHVERLVETGLLSALIPELAPHFGNAPGALLPESGDEALRILDRLEILLVETEKISPKHRTRFRDFIEVPPRRALLKLATLLRPLETNDTGDAFAALLARTDSPAIGIMKGLRLSNDNIRFTDRALTIHRYLVEHTETLAGEADGDDASGMYQLCKLAEDDLFSATILATAVKMEREDDLQSFLLALNRIVEFYLDTYRPAQEQPALLNGRTLLRKFQLAPSPKFKTILDRVEEARVLGRVSTRSEAEALAAELIQQLQLNQET